MAYVCKTADCNESVAWHLQNGDLDCIGDNKDAVAAFANAAETLKEEVATLLAAPHDPGLVQAFTAYEASN